MFTIFVEISIFDLVCWQVFDFCLHFRPKKFEYFLLTSFFLFFNVKLNFDFWVHANFSVLFEISDLFTFYIKYPFDEVFKCNFPWQNSIFIRHPLPIRFCVFTTFRALWPSNPIMYRFIIHILTSVFFKFWVKTAILHLLKCDLCLGKFWLHSISRHLTMHKFSSSWWYNNVDYHAYWL